MPLPLPDDVIPFAADPTRRLGRYVLMKRIGKGGQSEVWRAWDTVLARAVAVKILRDAEPEDVVRFRREANILANLHHPNIAPVFEMEQEGNRAYIAMQLVDGDTIDKVDAPLKKKAEHLRDAARALHFAHKQGIIHRDIKPTNIMATPDGHLFLLDFGIARPVRRGATITGTDFLVGTPAYMAPEQARGGRCDERTDVYALGATLYRLATHSDPFYGDDPMQVLLKVSNETPPRARTLEPTVPRAIEDIIRIAMSKDSTERYVSAEEFASQLDAFLAGKKVRAAPRDKIKIPPGAWIAVLAVITVAAVAWAIFKPPADRPPTPVVNNQPLVAPPVPPASADRELMAARELIDRIRQPDLKPEVRDKCANEARGLLAEFLFKFPSHPAALYESAKLEALTGTPDAALAAADLAIEKDPGNAAASLLRARLRIKRALSLKTRHIASLSLAGTDAANVTQFLLTAAAESPAIHALFSGADQDLASFSSSTASNQATDTAFAAGLTHFNTGHFNEAVTSFAAAADSPWLGVDARLLLGISAYMANKFNVGEEALTKAGSGDEVVEARLLLALLLSVEVARRRPARDDTTGIERLIDLDLAALAKIQPKSAKWLELVPMSDFWQAQFDGPIRKGR